MKREIAALILCALLTLPGCGEALAGSAASPFLAEPAASGSAAMAEPVSYTVECAVREETVCADDGTALAHYRYELPVLRAFRPDGTEITEALTEGETRALTAVRAFDEKFESWAVDANFPEIASWAAESYGMTAQGDAGPWIAGMTYEAQLACSVWQTEGLVSVFGEYYSFTGGAHPNTVRLAWNFDLSAGAFLDASSLALDEPEFHAAVTEELLRQADLPNADGTIPSAGYWDNYRDIVDRWPSYAVYFDDDGMHVDFSAYELACYAAGAQRFTIGYDTLSPYLSPYGRQMLSLPEPEG